MHFSTRCMWGPRSVCPGGGFAQSPRSGPHCNVASAHLWRFQDIDLNFFWKWKQDSVSFFATKKFPLEFTFPAVCWLFCSIFTLRTRMIKLMFSNGNMEPLHAALFLPVCIWPVVFLCCVFTTDGFTLWPKGNYSFQEIVTRVALPVAEVCWLCAFSILLFRVAEVVRERCRLFGQQTLDSNHCLSLSLFL